MSEEEVQWECPKQAADIERAGMGTDDVADLVRGSADFVFGKRNAGIVGQRAR